MRRRYFIYLSFKGTDFHGWQIQPKRNSVQQELENSLGILLQEKVAVLGGSGGFAIGPAKASGADIFITADLKYHDFFSAENDIVVADIGHYESEQFTKKFLVDYLSKKISNFAIILSNTDTNPVKYL